MDDIKTLYRKYIETQAEISRLEKEKNDLRSRIISHLGDKMALQECGFDVKLTPAVRKTLNAQSIEKAFDIKLTTECYKITSYNTLSVTAMTA